MSQQQSLFGPGRGHQGNDNSLAAYKALDLPVAQARVLQALVRRGSAGATADELVADLGLTHNSVAPRLIELSREGYVTKTVLRRETRSGNKATVYVARPRKAEYPD